MKIACIIPARFNSSRFPEKLLANVFGKTVLQMTIESALNFFDPNQVFVATDNDRIIEHVNQLHVQWIRTSSHCLNGTERISEALLKIKKFTTLEIIVNLQGDHPCTKPETFKKLIESLLLDPTAVMSTVATPIQTLFDYLSPHVVKVVKDLQNNALYFSRSPIPYSKDKLPENALQHIGLYCFRKDFLLKYPHLPSTNLQMMEDLEQLKALENGEKIKVAVVLEKAIGVDTPEDLQNLKSHIQRVFT